MSNFKCQGRLGPSLPPPSDAHATSIISRLLTFSASSQKIAWYAGLFSCASQHLRRRLQCSVLRESPDKIVKVRAVDCFSSHDSHRGEKYNRKKSGDGEWQNFGNPVNCHQ